LAEGASGGALTLVAVVEDVLELNVVREQPVEEGKKIEEQHVDPVLSVVVRGGSRRKGRQQAARQCEGWRMREIGGIHPREETVGADHCVRRIISVPWDLPAAKTPPRW
jgi:hypothetical protein